MLRLPAATAMLLSAALIACDGGGTPSQAGGGADAPRRSRPLAVCTTPMVGDLVRQIAGDAVEVVTLISAGTDPHLWTPTRTEVVSILEADAVFMNGLLLEGRAGDAFARVEQAGRPVVRVAESISRDQLAFDPANSSMLDPHVWMDPVLWAGTAPAVVEGLVKIAPNSRGSFEGNAQRFAAAAAELDT
ncbi:MAG: metal ABC transporter substrate-binding protein, partial [Phycisphaerales bacterium]